MPIFWLDYLFRSFQGSTSCRSKPSKKLLVTPLLCSPDIKCCSDHGIFQIIGINCSFLLFPTTLSFMREELASIVDCVSWHNTSGTRSVLMLVKWQLPVAIHRQWAWWHLTFSGRHWSRLYLLPYFFYVDIFYHGHFPEANSFLSYKGRERTRKITQTSEFFFFFLMEMNMLPIQRLYPNVLSVPDLLCLIYFCALISSSER